MVDFSAINDYLSRYWVKYPIEQKNDPSISQIHSFINNGGSYFLKDNIFILYRMGEDISEIVFYWCDMGGMPLKKIKSTLRSHKEFIKSLGTKVYSRDIKKLFSRDYLVEYDEKLKLWRWA